MGDHCVLMVDRLLLEPPTSTLGTPINGSANGIRVVRTEELDVAEGKEREKEKEMEMEVELAPVARREEDVGGGHVSSQRESISVECRICHEEEAQELCNMESPCSCSGSLKYAHRKCVQRWCNEKGDTMCEICLEAFKPGYTSPPKLFHQGRAPINFRDNWEVSGRMAMFPTDGGGYSDEDFDEYGSPSKKSLLLCRIIAVIFMAVLVLRHILPVILNEEELSLEDFSLFAMRIAAIFFPLYVIIQMFSFLYIRRRRQEDRGLPVAAFGGENGRLDSSERSWWQLQLMHII